MIHWKIEESGFDPDRISKLGNKFLTGNGYMGIRGTLQEYTREQYPAINMAGIYDRVGNAWREPLNAPNGLYTYITFNDKSLRLPEDVPESHKVSLNYRHGIFERTTVWDISNGKLTVQSERFASLGEKHLIVMKYCITSEAEGEVKLFTGIDGQVWDINGPHYDSMEFVSNDGILTAIGITHENQDKVCVAEDYNVDFDVSEEVVELEGKFLRVLRFAIQPGRIYTLIKYITVYTSKDTKDYKNHTLQLIKQAKTSGYNELCSAHREEWEEKWKYSEVIIEGDDEAMEALNYSIYHLHCIAPRHTDQLSIAARGLSGQTYKGAVFWDTEMFMLDFFLFTEPEVAKTLLKYRIDTLEGAKNKAKGYGYQGAFYAWESQEGGYDACSDYNVTDVFTGREMRTYFRDKQIHISSAIVYGLRRYMEITGDRRLFAEGGAEVILECANFYYDLLIRKVNGSYYELHDVIGPDEYHERVNNNAYTNRMAKYTFDSAVYVIRNLQELEAEEVQRLNKLFDLSTLLQNFQDASDKLYIPQPEEESGVVEQFDGYSQLEEVSIEEVRSRLLHEKEYWGGAYGVATHTKVIKQADVITMLNLFPEDYSEEQLLKNWNYYEPRTEHGSSLSACMYAMLACRCNMPEKAYPFFMKSAQSDLTQKGKEWAGLIYIGGTHPAASGGAYMTAIEGFGGIRFHDGSVEAYPELPSGWRKLQFHLVYRGERYQITITQAGEDVQKIGSYR